MARSQGSGGRNRERKGGQTPGDGVQDVYRELLRDTLASFPPLSSAEERPLKRRKTNNAQTPGSSTMGNEKPLSATDSRSGLRNGSPVQEPQQSTVQTIYNDSEDSAESDHDWEDVNLASAPSQDLKQEDNKDISFVLGGNSERIHGEALSTRRKPVTAAERKLRLDIHKLHVLCLLAHIHLRNHWCNDEAVNQPLRGLLSKKTVSYLNSNENLSQFQRTRSFVDGLSQAIETFKLNFTVTARGTSRSYWAENADELANIKLPDDLDLPVQREDFYDAAKERKGSRDIGAQLFCALLRSVGVDTRLTCSLQPLPFNGAAKGKPVTPVKPLVYVATGHNNADHAKDREIENSGERDEEAPAIGSLGGRSRFASGPTQVSGQAVAQASGSNSTKRVPGYVPLRPKRMVESPFPIYWVEVFDEAAQKWICVDPLVTHTVGKPSRLEPPASDQENNMCYVVAFEDDGSARDVTRRYAKAYNAKTRKSRLESTKEGSKWLRRVMKIYKKPLAFDRDQLEDAEFVRKEAQEKLPENVQDFKDHPYYALERHLKRNEVIHPKRETGKVMTGRAGSAKGSEPVYRRSDVHVVRSADSWYRNGREIKPGEQPLKRVSSRRKRPAVADDEGSDEDGDEATHTGLYAAYQTIEYRAPPIMNGRVPRNVYGNLDVYVPGMIPTGGAHVKHPESARAAWLLGVDYADAVTGFVFKGRHGTAVLNGAVVAAEYVPAIREVIDGFVNERVQEEEAHRSLVALGMWKRFLAGLRVRERIEGYSVEGEVDISQEDAHSEGESPRCEAGGFFPTGDNEDVAEPTATALGQGIAQESMGGGFFEVSTSAEASYNLIEPKPTGSDSLLNLEMRDFSSETSTKNLEQATAQRPSLQIDVVYGKPIVEDLEHRMEEIQPGGFLTGEYAQSQGIPANNEVDRKSSLFHMADEDLAEATILQQTYESQHRLPSPNQHNTLKDESEALINVLRSGSTTSDSTSLPLPRNTEYQAPGKTGLSSPADTSPAHEISDDDKGSLISEDPDDEDADPEWLA